MSRSIIREEYARHLGVLVGDDFEEEIVVAFQQADHGSHEWANSGTLAPTQAGCFVNAGESSAKLLDVRLASALRGLAAAGRSNHTENGSAQVWDELDQAAVALESAQEALGAESADHAPARQRSAVARLELQSTLVKSPGRAMHLVGAALRDKLGRLSDPQRMAQAEEIEARLSAVARTVKLGDDVALKEWATRCAEELAVLPEAEHVVAEIGRARRNLEQCLAALATEDLELSKAHQQYMAARSDAERSWELAKKYADYLSTRSGCNTSEAARRYAASLADGAPPAAAVTARAPWKWQDNLSLLVAALALFVSFGALAYTIQKDNAAEESQQRGGLLNVLENLTEFLPSQPGGTFRAIQPPPHIELKAMFLANQAYALADALKWKVPASQQLAISNALAVAGEEERASELLTGLLDGADEPSLTRGEKVLAYRVQATIASDRGDADTALTALDEAIGLLVKSKSPTDRTMLVDVRTDAMQVAAFNDRWERVEATRERIEREIERLPHFLRAASRGRMVYAYDFVAYIRLAALEARYSGQRDDADFSAAEETLTEWEAWVRRCKGQQACSDARRRHAFSRLELAMNASKSEQDVMNALAILEAEPPPGMHGGPPGMPGGPPGMGVDPAFQGAVLALLEEFCGREDLTSSGISECLARGYFPQEKALRRRVATAESLARSGDFDGARVAAEAERFLLTLPCGQEQRCQLLAARVAMLELRLALETHDDNAEVHRRLMTAAHYVTMGGEEPTGVLRVQYNEWTELANSFCASPGLSDTSRAWCFPCEYDSAPSEQQGSGRSR